MSRMIDRTSPPCGWVIARSILTWRKTWDACLQPLHQDAEQVGVVVRPDAEAIPGFQEAPFPFQLGMRVGSRGIQDQRPGTGEAEVVVLLRIEIVDQGDLSVGRGGALDYRFQVQIIVRN